MKIFKQVDMLFLCILASVWIDTLKESSFLRKGLDFSRLSNGCCGTEWQPGGNGKGLSDYTKHNSGETGML